MFRNATRGESRIALMELGEPYNRYRLRSSQWCVQPQPDHRGLSQ